MTNFVSILDNPYEIAKENDIHVIEEDLGNQIAGFYLCVDEVRLIHINSRIERKEEYLKELLDIASTFSKKENTIKIIPATII